jgi:integrase
MQRGKERLSALAVRRARKPGLYADGGNLYLRVGEGAAKSWVFRYMVGGKAREAGLGSAATFDLKEARERARQWRQQLADGIDPLAARARERQSARTAAAKAMTFRQCAQAYIAAHEASWRSAKHAAQWPSTLATYVYPIFGDLPVGAIDTALVMRAVEPIWQTKPETASRVRGRIESALDWAAARGHRQGENPARWKGHLENLLPKVAKAKAAKRRASGRGEHLAALAWRDVPAFMADLRRQEGIAAKALEFAVLCAARTREVIGARWHEIDVEARVWVVPGARMKGGREHRVPLSERAIAILMEMAAIRESDFVFPGGRAGQPLNRMAMLETLRRMGRGMTVHGFRSSFADWCAEATNFPSEVREMALAHTVGTAVEQAYRRGDLYEKRRQLAEAWARFCTSPAETPQVVPLRRVAGAAATSGKR